jgi:hypothetical protein
MQARQTYMSGSSCRFTLPTGNIVIPLYKFIAHYCALLKETLSGVVRY